MTETDVYCNTPAVHSMLPGICLGTIEFSQDAFRKAELGTNRGKGGYKQRERGVATSNLYSTERRKTCHNRLRRFTQTTSLPRE